MLCMSKHCLAGDFIKGQDAGATSEHNSTLQAKSSHHTRPGALELSVLPLQPLQEQAMFFSASI